MGVIVTLENGDQIDGEDFVIGMAASELSYAREEEALKAWVIVCRTNFVKAVGDKKEVKAEDLSLDYIIPEVLLFQENCQTQRKSAVLRFGSRIIITTFYLKNSGMLLFLSVCSKGLSMGNHLSFHNLSCLFIVSCVTSVYI